MNYYLSQPTMLIKLLATISLVLTCQICTATEPIRILTWNLAGRADDTAEVILKLKQLKADTEIVVLADVPKSAVEPIAEALDWKYFASGSDKALMIAWSSRFSKTQAQEIRSQNTDEPQDEKDLAPIFARLLDRKNQNPLIVVNHQQRTDDEATSIKHAEMIVAMSKSRAQIPAIAVSHGASVDLKAKRSEAILDLFQKDDEWKWISPEGVDAKSPTPGAASDNNAADATLSSIRTLIFANKAAQELKSSCDIIAGMHDNEGDLKDFKHWPVLVTVEPKSKEVPVPQRLTGRVAQRIKAAIREFGEDHRVLEVNYLPISDRFDVKVEWVWEKNYADEKGYHSKKFTISSTIRLSPDGKGNYRGPYRSLTEKLDISIKADKSEATK